MVSSTTLVLIERLRLATRCGLAALAFAASITRLRALDPRTAANGYLLHSWQTETGLPSNKVRDIQQTRDGYLWLATHQGFARFDGNRFTVYSSSTNPELQPGFCYAVIETPDGQLWMGSNSGLYRWDNGYFTRFTVENGLASNGVRSFTLARDGTLVVGTNRGPSFWRQGHLETPEKYLKQMVGNVRAYAETRDGAQYFGTENGLWRVRGEVIEKLSGTPDFPGNTYGALLCTDDGKLWVGSSAGLHCISPDGSVRTYGPAEGLGNPRVQCLSTDHDKNLWIGTTGGLFRMHDEKIEAAFYADTLGASTVVDVYEDRDGALWVATFTGLYRLTNPTFSGVGVADGLEHLAVYSAIEARDGTWWIGTWGGGVYRYDHHIAIRLEPPAGTTLDQIFGFYESSDGAVWICANNGLFCWRDGALQSLFIAPEGGKLADVAKPGAVFRGVVHRRVNAVTSDGADGLWIGTNGGLYHERGGEFRLVSVGSDGPGPDFRCVATGETPDSVWVFTPEGMAHLRDGKWRQYPLLPGQYLDSTRSVYSAGHDTFWMPTQGHGLHRFRAGKWTAYTMKDGLVDDFIASVALDDQGYFWIGSSRGVMRIASRDFDDFDAGKITQLRPALFTRFDGMTVTECNFLGSPAVSRTRDGKLLFPTDRGLVFADPSHVMLNKKPPIVHIEHMRVGGAEANLAGPLVVPPNHLDLEFDYTAISLIAPEKVRFKVKLSPVDTEWHDAGSARLIRYPRLPYGEYEFHVLACNNDGVWNEKGATLVFKVSPFFYQTHWFRFLLLLAGGGLIFGAIRWRVLHLQKRALVLQRQNAELERRIAERTAELAKSYEALRASEYFYHSLVESLPQIIVRKDAAGRFTYANSAFAELVGRPLKEIIGNTDSELYPAAVAEKFRADDIRVMESRQPLEYENVVEKEGGRKQYLHVKKVPLYDAQSHPLGVLMLFWDMSVFRETEEKLKQAQKELVETSRLAGMAEVATGVLHNIGNVLNSVNTSATVASDRIRTLKIPGVAKAAQLLIEQGERLADFLVGDPRGRQLPSYLAKLNEHLEGQRNDALNELKSLQAHIEHIKEIVMVQQSHARVSGIVESVPPTELVEYALRMNGASLTRHGVTVTREFMPVPLVKVQRQKALQILVNLICNAKDAMDASGRKDKLLTVAVRAGGEGRVCIHVTDNGSGIAPENLTRIFAFGFTTKKDGHGFGLHSSALAAREMGGALNAQSPGAGLGATFVLELPATDEAEAETKAEPLIGAAKPS